MAGWGEGGHEGGCRGRLRQEEGRGGWRVGGGGKINPSQKVLVCGGREPCDIVNHFETDLKTIYPAGITCIFLRLP